MRSPDHDGPEPDTAISDVELADDDTSDTDPSGYCVSPETDDEALNELLRGIQPPLEPIAPAPPPSVTPDRAHAKSVVHAPIPRATIRQETESFEIDDTLETIPLAPRGPRPVEQHVQQERTRRVGEASFWTRRIRFSSAEWGVLVGMVITTVLFALFVCVWKLLGVGGRTVAYRAPRTVATVLAPPPERVLAAAPAEPSSVPRAEIPPPPASSAPAPPPAPRKRKLASPVEAVPQVPRDEPFPLFPSPPPKSPPLKGDVHWNLVEERP